jgi:CBS domain containing-hemolysin-like protein
LGYIPKEGENPSVEVNHTLFTVLSVEDRRIEKVRVEKLPIPEKKSEEKED